MDNTVTPFEKWTPEQIRNWSFEAGSIDYTKDISVIDAMVHTKFVPSRSEAKRLIQQKAVRLNGKVVSDINAKIEMGELQVGKLKTATLEHYLKMNIFCSSGGYASIDVVPLLKTHKKEAIIDALARGTEFMEDKGYVNPSHLLSNDFKNHFRKLVLNDLVHFVEKDNGEIEICVHMNSYLQDIELVKVYVKLKDVAARRIKEAKLSKKAFLKVECPKCKDISFEGAYNNVNTYPERQYNVNGVCRNCKFTINELI